MSSSKENSLSSLPGVNDALHEARMARVRQILRENKIQLWKDPYYSEDGGAENLPKLLDLASNLAVTIDDLDEDIIADCLKELQRNALDTLEAREALARSNMLTVKVKLSKGLKLKGVSKVAKLTVNVDIYSTADELATEIASKLLVIQEGKDQTESFVDCEPESLRLICNGKTISTGGSEDTKGQHTLSQLGIKPGAVVMAVLIDASDHSLAVVTEQRKILNTAKSDAEMFADDGRLELTDQSGKEVELPKAEKDALVMAMSLHEKGRAAMKKANFELGLVLLLEASEEYDNCRAQILNSVDNYAILNLDIAWCYLRIGNVSELPDAYKRLADCESKFVASYGANLERVKAVKGHAGEESVLLVRMHLLQAVVAFHRGHISEAKKLISSTKTELNSLRVPDDELGEVIANGFTEREARMALRFVRGGIPEGCSSVIAAACKYAHRAREEKKKVMEEEKRRKKRRLKFGKTLSGNWVNLGLLETMTRMGYEERLAAEALRQTENDVNAATETLNEKPELLVAAIEEKEFDPSQVTEEMVSPLLAMGFDEKDSINALVKFKGDAAGAIEALTSGADLTPPSKRGKKELQEELQKEKRKLEAYDRLAEDLEEAEPEAYLDLTLDDEKHYLDKYLSLMGL